MTKMSKYFYYNPCWATGFIVEKTKIIDKNKLKITIGDGEYYTLHRNDFKQKKCVVKLHDIDLVFNKYYVIIYLINGKIRCSLNGIPNGCDSILLLYGFDIIVGNGKITDYTYEDLRGKKIVTK